MCGTGIDVHCLRKAYDAEFTVSDLSNKAIRITLNLNRNVSGSVSDIEQLSLADGSFDYVFVAVHRYALVPLPRPGERKDHRLYSTRVD